MEKQTRTSLRDEVVELLVALLRLDTVSPPGNETLAADVLRDYLARSGVEGSYLSKVPERANLIARLPGGDGPTLSLIAHTDTVRAEPEDWTHSPWSGHVEDGEVWGRGALDMKGQVAASAVAFASLARERFVPSGDLLLVLHADEEVGDDFGMSWLAREHPESVRADFCLNEGGGERVVLGGRPIYLCTVGEKMTAPFIVRVRGRAGHASVPSISDNALVKAAPILEALARLQPPKTLLPPVARFLETVLGEAPPPEVALDRARALHPLAAELVEPLLSLTLAPTMIEASKQRNVIPGTCEITVDCRMLPGQGPADLEPLLRAGLPAGDWELEWLEAERLGGSSSPTDTPLWAALQAWVDRVEPGARLAPLVSAGFTDSHWLREAFGTVAYGFMPLRAMDAEVAGRLVHSTDERAAIDDLVDAVDVFRHVAQTLLS